mmetsp:Transcript_75065/g.219928  ORF Transcript_75065/g.219928 Transcript_75065/m.219928 type:complete len:274 (-) Transcript_75065:165-986(-)
MIGPASTASDMQVFWRSLALVGIAELFDKTWFMGLLLALRYSPRIVFAGSFLALFLHCFFAAAFGLAFARLIPQSTLNFLAAALFAFFAILYAKDWYKADPAGDAIAAGREEAAEDCGDDVTEETGTEVINAEIVGKESKEENEANNGEEATLVNSNNAASGTVPKQSENGNGQTHAVKIAFTKSFIGVFIAEWGDRTQIAMIGQHASQPLIPVFVGSAIAFFLLTLSAVGLASVANQMKLSERVVHGMGSASFAIFSLLALKDSIEAIQQHP